MSYLRYLLPLVWTAVIFHFSSQQYTATQTAGWLGNWIAMILPWASTETVSVLHILTRKMAHVAVYGVLYTCWATAIATPSRQQISLQKTALTLSILTACLDELNQRLVPGRSGSFLDIGLDTLGILIAAFLISKIRGRK